MSMNQCHLFIEPLIQERDLSYTEYATCLAQVQLPYVPRLCGAACLDGCNAAYPAKTPGRYQDVHWHLFEAAACCSSLPFVFRI